MFRLCLMWFQSTFLVSPDYCPISLMCSYFHRLCRTTSLPRLACLFPMCINTSVCALLTRQNVSSLLCADSLKASLLRNCIHRHLFLIMSLLSPFGLSAFLINGFDFDSCLPFDTFAFRIFGFDSSSPLDYSFTCRFCTTLLWLPGYEICLNKQCSLLLPWSASGSLFRRNTHKMLRLWMWGEREGPRCTQSEKRI